MKDCAIIQPELSAYVDGELPPSERGLIEEHLASCPRCRQELEELKALTAGVAALPRLRPEPQFLSDVRRKIVRGDRPEPVTWQDYLFRPVWLKVPLELAAVIAIAISVMRSEQPVLVENTGSEELSKTAEFENQRDAAVQRQPETPQRFEEAKVARAEQPAPPPSAPGNEMVSTSPEESMSSISGQPTNERQGEPTEVAAPAPAGEEVPLPDTLGKKSSAAGSGGSKRTVQSTRRVASRNAIAGGLTVAPAPTPPDISGIVQSLGIERSKLGDVMIVRDKGFRNVQDRAQQLAAKCNGRIILVPQFKDSTGQVFLVELPPEYVASFKLALMQSNDSPLWTTGVTSDENLRVLTNATSLVLTGAAPAAGELTGNRATNAAFGGLGQLALTNDAKVREAAMAIVEIMVVPPPGAAGTNAIPVGVTPSN